MATTEDASLVRLQIAADQDPRSREPVLRVSFRNETWDRLVWLKHAVSAVSATDDLQLDVVDDSGKQWRPNCKVRDANVEPSASSYTLLTPQAEISRLTTLSCFRFAPGRYRIAARYRDTEERPPPLRGATWFRGHLTSNTIYLEVNPH